LTAAARDGIEIERPGHGVIAGLVMCRSCKRQWSETMSKSNQYVGLDVSLKETSICVIDDADKIVWRGRVDSTAAEGLVLTAASTMARWRGTGTADRHYAR
jgi:hypothetical protein